MIAEVPVEEASPQTEEVLMGSMIFISTMAIIVAIVGCAVIWRMDALRADEIERPAAAPVPRALDRGASPAPAPRPLPRR